MEQYRFLCTVERVVIDTVSLSVNTDKGAAEARKLAQEVLTEYPDPSFVPDVPYCYIENRKNVSVKVVDTERMIPTDD